HRDYPRSYRVLHTNTAYRDFYHLPYTTLFRSIPAFCLRGPPSREKGQKQSMPASTIVIPSPLVGEGQGEGGGVSRFNTELPTFTLIPAFSPQGRRSKSGY